MPSSFNFWLPKIKKEILWSCDISFLKIIVYSDVVLDKLGQSYKSIFPSKIAES